MDGFFSTQLDFVLFFYGLAFILLGGICLFVKEARGPLNFPYYLGSFALLHGVGEWLDLFALLAGDAPAFAIARTCLMTASFVLLVEFSRLNARQFGIKVPGRLWYLPLLFLIAGVGASTGLNAANAVARYTTGLVGALAAAWVFGRTAAESPGHVKPLAIIAIAGWTLYGIAAGVVVPHAPFWPASALNYEWFADVTGVPIQLVRGLIACCIAFSIWGLGKRTQSAEVASARYTTHVHSMLRLTLLCAMVILVGGWMLTQTLGEIRARDMKEESLSDINLLVNRFDDETATLDRMVKVLAGSPSLLPLLSPGRQHEGAVGNSLLDLSVAGADADAALVFDASGTAVGYSINPSAASGRLQHLASSQYLQQSPGEAAYHIAVDATTGNRAYFTSYPVHAADGTVAGVAVLTKSLDLFARDLNGFDRSFFLIDAHGLILLSDRTDLVLRPLWPLPGTAQPPRAARRAELSGAPLVDREIADQSWANVGGERRYMRRRFENHGQWSLVLAMPASRVFASRFMGIVITMLVTIMVLIYLYLKDRSIRDHIELERRLVLQEVARDLRTQAVTDPLTGLFNRGRFDEVHAEAIARAERYGIPFSLVLFDVDAFKAINDTHGHQVGDKVLVRLSGLVSEHIRAPDLVARWGGEEFIILAHGVDLVIAHQVAERLRIAIQQTLFDPVGTIACSFGVSQYTEGDTAQTLLARADKALYRAKSRGRNRVEFTSADESADLVALSGSMRAAH